MTSFPKVRSGFTLTLLFCALASVLVLTSCGKREPYSLGKFEEGHVLRPPTNVKAIAAGKGEGGHIVVTFTPSKDDKYANGSIIYKPMSSDEEIDFEEVKVVLPNEQQRPDDPRVKYLVYMAVLGENQALEDLDKENDFVLVGEVEEGRGRYDVNPFGGLKNDLAFYRTKRIKIRSAPREIRPVINDEGDKVYLDTKESLESLERFEKRKYEKVSRVASPYMFIVEKSQETVIVPRKVIEIATEADIYTISVFEKKGYKLATDLALKNNRGAWLLYKVDKDKKIIPYTIKIYKYEDTKKTAKKLGELKDSQWMVNGKKTEKNKYYLRKYDPKTSQFSLKKELTREVEKRDEKEFQKEYDEYMKLGWVEIESNDDYVVLKSLKNITRRYEINPKLYEQLYELLDTGWKMVSEPGAEKNGYSLKRAKHFKAFTISREVNKDNLEIQYLIKNGWTFQERDSEYVLAGEEKKEIKKIGKESEIERIVKKLKQEGWTIESETGDVIVLTKDGRKEFPKTVYPFEEYRVRQELGKLRTQGWEIDKKKTTEKTYVLWNEGEYEDYPRHNQARMEKWIAEEVIALRKAGWVKDRAKSTETMYFYNKPSEYMELSKSAKDFGEKEKDMVEYGGWKVSKERSTDEYAALVRPFDSWTISREDPAKAQERLFKARMKGYTDTSATTSKKYVLKKTLQVKTLSTIFKRGKELEIFRNHLLETGWALDEELTAHEKDQLVFTKALPGKIKDGDTRNIPVITETKESKDAPKPWLNSGWQEQEKDKDHIILFKPDKIEAITRSWQDYGVETIKALRGKFQEGQIWLMASPAAHILKREYKERSPIYPGECYVFYVKFKYGDKEADSAITPPVYPSAELFEATKLPTLIMTVLFIGVVGYFIRAARKGKDLYIRPIAGISAVEEAVGRAAETGKTVMYIPGIGGIADIATLASLAILARIAEKTATYDTGLICPNYDPIVLQVAQEVVKGSYLKAGRPDAFSEDMVFFLSQRQFAYAAGVSGLIAREKPSTIFLMGTFFAESLLLAEAGNAVGAVQIAGTDRDHQLPFFVTACDYTLIGEELYAAGAYLSRDPKLLGSLKGQDWYKAFVVILLVSILGIVLVSMATGDNVITWLFREIFAAEFIIPFN